MNISHHATWGIIPGSRLYVGLASDPGKQIVNMVVRKSHFWIDFKLPYGPYIMRVRKPGLVPYELAIHACRKNDKTLHIIRQVTDDKYRNL